jgi:endo-1,3(4)-beta-glucanase
VVGVLWSTKVDHTPFFGDNTEYIYGIQMLPFTPATAAPTPSTGSLRFDENPR